VEDDLPNNVKRVLVLYKPEQSGEWRLLDLVLDPVGQRWTGAAPLSGAVQYTVYALDTAGNVALSTNKGEFHTTIAPPTQSGVAVTVAGTEGGGSWYLDATVSVVGPSGVPLTVKVDNGPAQLYAGPFALTGTGIHLVTAEAPDGSFGGAIVPIDSVGPTASFTAPFEGATYTIGQPVVAEYVCLDAGSGAAECSGTVANGVALDTSTSGPRTFTVSSLDVAGNAGFESIQYIVADPCAGPDTDCDGLLDSADNCDVVPNPDQANNDRNFISNAPVYPSISDRTMANSDAVGDVCDLDDDNDGLTDALEDSGAPCPSATAATDPLDIDTDGDRFTDGMECGAGTDPADPSSKPSLLDCDSTTDTDGDGLSDRLESCFYNTDPANVDTDGDRTTDGATDGCEVASINGDRVVNSGDQGMLGAGISGAVAYHPNLDMNKDGVLNSGDQGLVARFIRPPGQCP
jgi:hypothetical protein